MTLIKSTHEHYSHVPAKDMVLVFILCFSVSNIKR